ncbi:MAG: cytochrome d ubiquinol oxidase subunit II [Elusimicrobiales bacterium]|jgi:cytochrome d ubiquinol oxidase subunit II
MDYAKLWFGLWGVLWAVYFALDGFDLGVGMVGGFVARGEAEKRGVFSSIGPFWDGNEVWLVAAGGVTFAAFPGAYAGMFSWFYSAMFLALFGLILRGVSLEFRGKVSAPCMKTLLDAGLAAGSFLSALCFGVLFGNLFRGLPLSADGYEGSFSGLFNPYGLLTGALFAALFAAHGSLWLSFKAPGAPAARAFALAKKLWAAAGVLCAAFFTASAFDTALYKNYLENKYLFAVPLVCVVAFIFARLLSGKRPDRAFLSSMVSIASLAAFGVIGLYPALLPSRSDPSFSVTIYNAASGPYTLRIMAAVTAAFLPLVIAYQFWVYRLFRAPLTAEELAKSGLHY